MMEGWEFMEAAVIAAGELAVLWAQCICLEKYLESPRWRMGLFFLLQAAGLIYMSFWDSWSQVPFLMQAGLHHLMFLGLVLLLFQGSRGKRLLAASMLLAARILGESFLGSLLFLLLLMGMHTARPDSGLVPGEWESCLAVGLGLCLTAMGILGLSRHVSKLLDGEEERPGRWNVLLAIPLLGFSGLADVAGWGASHGVMVRSGGNLGIYYDQLFSHGGMCVLAALSLAAAFFYLRGMVRMEREQQKSRRYQAQLAAYQMLEEQRSQSESLRHDMKNHILALNSLWEGREWEKLGEYLEQMAEGCSLKNGGETTGNRVADALLFQKEHFAREKGISWECSVFLPPGSGVREMDWCILLGNLLDNALNACGQMTEEGARFIRIKAGRVKGCFLLEVKNSMAFRGREGRGIGLRNVQDLVERYGGILETKGERGVFTASVLLPLGVGESA